MLSDSPPNSRKRSAQRRGRRLTQRLAHGEILLLDGATGTELQRRQVPVTLPLWSALALIEQPAVVRQIHEAYIAAGADIITTNTFRTTRRTLRRAGVSDADVRIFNDRAVSLARTAASSSGREVLVAGSIAPLEDCYSPALTPPFDEALTEHREQSRFLADAGVDMILIETMPSAAEADAAALAATETGLDVAVSVVCGENGHLLSGESLADVVSRVTRHGATALLINCATPSVIEHALGELVRLTDLPIGGYANIGVVGADNTWTPDPRLTPARYTDMVAAWCAAGARIVGGCCGTTPAHIASIRGMLDKLMRED